MQRLRSRVSSARSSWGEALGLTSFDLVLADPGTQDPSTDSQITSNLSYRLLNLTYQLHSPSTKPRKCTYIANSSCFYLLIDDHSKI